MRGAAALAAALALTAGCSGKTEPAKGKDMAIYEDPSKHFVCEAPSAWRVKEEGGMVSFYGPPQGPQAFSARVSIRYFPKGSAAATPQAYALAQKAAGAKVEPLEETTWKGSRAWSFSSERTLKARHGKIREQRRLERTALIPASGGLFAVVHSASAEMREATAPVFNRILETFQPR